MKNTRRNNARTSAALLLALAACGKGGASDANGAVDSAAGKRPSANAKDTSLAASQPMIIGPENIIVIANGQLTTGPALSGTLSATRTAIVRAQVSGPVLQTSVERGQRVSAGQSMAKIDDSSIRENVLSAQSAVHAAQLTSENANHDVERFNRLLAAGAVAERDVENSKRMQLTANAGLEDAKARLANAQLQLQRTMVRAPFAGIVSERQVNGGDVVQPGGAMFTVVDPSSMQLEATVPADQLAALRVGQTVQFSVTGYEGRAFTGRIDRINPSADPATRQVRLYATIPNAGGTLVTGLYAEGRVASDTKQGLVVPSTAVDSKGLQPAVLRLRNGRIERVVVQLGIRDEHAEAVEIKSGLAPGDTVLVGAAQGLSLGTPVRVMATGDRK
ncbi:MAG: efflux RND transporter periplasmic adaptor subunit [Gemmatimonadota bacterium]|nr:efflux RND transporter periplasmic adaptor subunit [Gemmatimonadota bacterium]